MSERGVRSLFIEEAAQMLGASRRTVYYRIREGRLQTIRTKGGSQRVLVSSLEALLRDGWKKPRGGSTPPDPADSETEALPL
jgi:excisionase family DNA binding protein